MDIPAASACGQDANLDRDQAACAALSTDSGSRSAVWRRSVNGVATGRAIALLPEFAVRADLDSGRLAAVDGAAPPPLRLRLVWRSSADAANSLRPLLYALTGA